MAMCAGLLFSCSNDDQTVFNEENVEVLSVQSVQSVQTLEECTVASALAGTATLSSYANSQITFQWNSPVDYSTNKTYASYIEIAEDPNCPNPVWAPAVAGTYPIDVLNTSSLVVPGVKAKCIQWRIVINGYVNSALDCTTTSEWMGATYVQ